MNPDKRRDRELYARPVRQLCIFVLAVLLLTQVALSAYAWALSEHRFLPELERKAKVVGTSVSAKLARAIGFGIPFNKLEGVKEFYDEILRENADVAYLTLTDASGKVLARGGRGGEVITPEAYLDTATPIVVRGVSYGFVHVGVDRRYIASRVTELRYDIGIILITSLLIAFEILWFIVTLNFSAPMRQIIGLMSRIASGDFRHRAVASPAQSLAAKLNQIESRINDAFNSLARHAGPEQLAALRKQYRFAEQGESRDLRQKRVITVRILTFLFMFAEMLSRPFLPLYAGTLSDHGLGLPEGLRASLPITAFLAGVALSMPFAGRWSDLIGRQRSYLTGAAMVALGLAGTGLIPEYALLVAARAMTGVGYAIMFMACQGFVFDSTDRSDSGKGMAMFVGAIMVAEICAPAVGGILADRIGYQMVFVAGALVAVLAGGLAVAVLDNQSAQPASQAPAAKRPFARLVRNRRFLALSILSGIPAKFMYTGFLIFLVPILLSSLGSTKSEIGRYTMLYGLTALLLAPLFARLADKYNAYGIMVVAGGLLTALGLLPVAQGASAGLVMLGIAALGLGQSMSISAQLVLVAHVTRAEARDTGTGPVLGTFRLIERLGAAAGPIATGALVAAYGAPKAMLTLGLAGLAASLLFALLFYSAGNDSEVAA